MQEIELKLTKICGNANHNNANETHVTPVLTKTP